MGALAALALGLCALACDPRRPDVREWTPADHHNNSKPTPGTVPAEPTPAAGQDANDNVVLIAWKNNCALCHGVAGRGDGPQGRMLQTRDLTDPTWQSSVTDEQIATVIRSGKGKMPAFRLPEPTLQALVRRIRSFGGVGVAASDPPASPSADAPPAHSGSARGGSSAVGGGSASYR